MRFNKVFFGFSIILLLGIFSFIPFKVNALTAELVNPEYKLGQETNINLFANPNNQGQNALQIKLGIENGEFINFAPNNSSDYIFTKDCANKEFIDGKKLRASIGSPESFVKGDLLGVLTVKINSETVKITKSYGNNYSDGKDTAIDAGDLLILKAEGNQNLSNTSSIISQINNSQVLWMVIIAIIFGVVLIFIGLKFKLFEKIQSDLKAKVIVFFIFLLFVIGGVVYLSLNKNIANDIPDSSVSGTIETELNSGLCGQRCGAWADGFQPLCSDGISTCSWLKGLTCGGNDETYCIPKTPKNGYSSDLCKSDLANAGYKYVISPEGLPITTQEELNIACGNASSAGSDNLQGYIDFSSCSSLKGWAWDKDQPNQVISLDLYIDGIKVSSFDANQSRPDVAEFTNDNGIHGFSITIPSNYKDNRTHQFDIKFGSTQESIDFGNNSMNFSCSDSEKSTNVNGQCGNIDIDNNGKINLVDFASFVKLYGKTCQ